MKLLTSLLLICGHCDIQFQQSIPVKIETFFVKFVPLKLCSNFYALFRYYVHNNAFKPFIFKVFSLIFTEISVRPNMTVKAVIMDPEIVFVANLTSADAPALKVSFQCDFSLTSGKIAQRMTAQLKGFKVLACAFLKEKQDKSVTTVRTLVFRNEKSNENCWQVCPLVGISIALRKSSFHIDYYEDRRGLGICGMPFKGESFKILF